MIHLSYDHDVVIINKSISIEQAAVLSAEKIGNFMFSLLFFLAAADAMRKNRELNRKTGFSTRQSVRLQSDLHLI